MSIHEDPWPEGTPAWVDLMVPDRHAARAFYGPLFGWEFIEGGPETGFYTTATVGGRSVAGFAEPMPGAASTPSTWTTYLAVDNDIVAVTGRARDAGAQVLFDPMTIMEFGAMAVLVDPTGAVFGLWQPGSHTGADVVNEPGALIWNEIMTRDAAAAQAFYGAVFGFTFGDMSGPGFVYATIDLDGRSVGGIGELAPETPDDVPAAWSTYFAVADTDAAAAKAVELGATILSAPADSPYGRIAVVRGPFGETFSIMSTTEVPSPPAHA